MEKCVEKLLTGLGYKVNNKPYEYIKECNEWYENKPIENFHNRTTIQGEPYEIERIGFAKRGCEDDANLCELLKIYVKDELSTKKINKVLYDNNFFVMYRKQLELMSATGTVACYIRLDNAEYLSNGKVRGGELKITYCKANNYIPLTVVNGNVEEAAFYGTDYAQGKKILTLVIFTKGADIENNYLASTYVFQFKDNGEEEIIKNYWLKLGTIKPFMVMRVAKVNNLSNMQGFGLPKIYNAIPTLKKIDLANMILTGDLERGEKMILTNEIMVPIDRRTGKLREKTPLMKKLFVFLGQDKLPDAKTVIQEYNPKIRIAEIKEVFELCLSIFSMMFGFGTKKYTFKDGDITTATQYIGERQDAMQDLNKQRAESKKYITDIIKAIMFYSNVFKSENFDIDSEVCIDFDDSYIEDKQSRIESLRQDAQAFSDIPEFTIQYIMARFNIDRDSAIKIYKNKDEENEDNSDVEENKSSEE